MRTFIVVAAIGFMAWSCAPQTDLQGLKNRIADYNRIAAESMISGDPEKALAYYDDDAISLPSNAPMLRGKDAIGKWMKDMSAMGVRFSKVEFSDVQIDASGSLGYEVGTYEMVMEIGGMTMPDKGKYLCVWKHQQDGSWKLLVETWNTDMPMPEPPQSAKSKK
ncbi:MAG: DUF4440 domain-containing protein [Ignavibacterium sp.]|jgi:ketosteroid isomerase-like protein